MLDYPVYLLVKEPYSALVGDMLGMNIIFTDVTG